MTFEEKLKKFKSERVGFIVDEEIVKELARVLDGDDRFRDTDGYTWGWLCANALHAYGDAAYIIYENEVSAYGKCPDPDVNLLDVTLEELKAYNG